MAYLNPGLKCCFSVIENEENIEYKEYFSENGLMDYLDRKINGKVKITDSIVANKEHEGVDVSLAFVYTDNYNSEDMITFVNNAATVDGGDHVKGFKDGLRKAIADYSPNSSIEPSDMLEGLTCVISVGVIDPIFDGQSKSKIKMAKVRTATRLCTESILKSYLDCNPDKAKALINKMINAGKARLAAVKAREAVRKIKETSDNPSGMAGKLTPCTTKNPAEAEIYIVEGDSAGGSAKQARDRRTQAILPIFGKPLNVEKSRLYEVVRNERLMDLVRALGCGIGEEFDITKLRYHKVVIMSDADVDGHHIKTLWTTFIYRHLKPLIENGYLYYSCAPLYKLVISKENVYAKDEEEKESLIAQFGNKVTNVSRFKGLGEMNAEQLWETTMNPGTRTMEQITIEDAEQDEYILSLCMGEEVAPRKEFIVQHSLEAQE